MYGISTCFSKVSKMDKTTFDTVIYLYDDKWLRLSIHIAASEILYENGKERIVPFIGYFRCRVLNGSEVFGQATQMSNSAESARYKSALMAHRK